MEEITLAPREATDQTVQYAEETFYFVVSGYGMLQSDVYGYALEPQVGVYLPSETAHSVRNTGAVDCVLVRYGFGAAASQTH